MGRHEGTKARRGEERDENGVVTMADDIGQVAVEKGPEGVFPQLGVVPVAEGVGVEPVEDVEVAAGRQYRAVNMHRGREFGRQVRLILELAIASDVLGGEGD